jgi:hypothetical protein
MESWPAQTPWWGKRVNEGWTPALFHSLSCISREGAPSPNSHSSITVWISRSLGTIVYTQFFEKNCPGLSSFSKHLNPPQGLKPTSSQGLSGPWLPCQAVSLLVFPFAFNLHISPVLKWSITTKHYFSNKIGRKGMSEGAKVSFLTEAVWPQANWGWAFMDRAKHP